MIHIYYRTTINNKPNNLRPEWFSYEKCFKNLLDTINDNCRLTIVFDGDSLSYNSSFFKKYEEKYKFNVKLISAGSDFSSNTQTFQFINTEKQIAKEDLVYVLENDYLHLPNWPEIVTYLYSVSEGVHYTTLFDHLDKYLFTRQDRDDEFGMYKNLVSKIYVAARHWRTVPNTCGSFILRKDIFDQDLDVHTSGKADNTRFGELAKRGRVVLSPVPSLGTHCQIPYIAPIINWRSISDATELFA